MGILNVTPDSFSDGGRYDAPEAAIAHAERMLEEGADIIDIGGESTRPGAQAIDAAEEIRRTESIVRALTRLGATVSIDTCKAEVARAALGAGAAVVNDVTALGDPEMAETCARAECAVCLMHMQGSPRTMQLAPSYGDVTQEVRAFLLERTAFAEARGIARERLWIDPGIGFGKTVEHNLTLLRRLDALVATGYPVLLGVSRKSFLGKLLGAEDAPAPLEARLEGTLAAQSIGQWLGARILRVHDVGEAVRAARIVAALTASPSR